MKKNKLLLHIIRFIVCIVLFFSIAPVLVGTDLGSAVTYLIVLAPISIMAFKDFFAIFDDVFQLITERKSKDKKEEQSNDGENK